MSSNILEALSLANRLIEQVTESVEAVHEFGCSDERCEEYERLLGQFKETYNKSVEILSEFAAHPKNQGGTVL